MVVSLLLWGPGNIHGFVLNGKSYRPKLAIAQTSTEFTLSGVKITTLMYRGYTLATIACGRWSLVTD